MTDAKLFKAGSLYMSRGVTDLIANNVDFAKYSLNCLRRHINGDWGEMDEEDKDDNNQALKQGLRLFSSYTDPRFPKNGVATIWIITEADRSSTTLLFPNEY